MSRIRKFWATLRKRPYVEVVSEGGNSKEGFALELDWNVHFINELEKHGISGRSDEEAVRNWMSRLMRAQDLEEYQAALVKEAQAAEREKKG
jgi:hypothetical protein